MTEDSDRKPLTKDMKDVTKIVIESLKAIDEAKKKLHLVLKDLEK